MRKILQGQKLKLMTMMSDKLYFIYSTKIKTDKCRGKKKKQTSSFKVPLKPNTRSKTIKLYSRLHKKHLQKQQGCYKTWPQLVRCSPLYHNHTHMLQN